MATYEECKIALNKGKGKGSYLIRKDGSKIHLAYLTTGDLEHYLGYEFAKGKSALLLGDDIVSKDWVVEE